MDIQTTDSAHFADIFFWYDVPTITIETLRNPINKLYNFVGLRITDEVNYPKCAYGRYFRLNPI